MLTSTAILAFSRLNWQIQEPVIQTETITILEIPKGVAISTEL